MDIKYLNYFIEIAKKKNITKAAEALYISQSSLSQYLARLEQDIGAELFVRTKGELVLTTAGKLYLDAASEVVQIRNSLYHSIYNLNNSGHISIGVTSIFALQMLADIVPKFKMRSPDVLLDITEMGVPSLTNRLLEGRIDCGLLALNRTTQFDKKQFVILREEAILFAVPEDFSYCVQNPGNWITFKEIMEHFKMQYFLLPRKGSTLRYSVDKIFGNEGFIPHVLCEINNIPTVKDMIKKGIGVTFLGESCSGDSKGIKYYRTDPKLSRYNVFVMSKTWQHLEPQEFLQNEILNYYTEEYWRL